MLRNKLQEILYPETLFSHGEMPDEVKKKNQSR
jgi:hypothetical protein